MSEPRSEDLLLRIDRAVQWLNAVVVAAALLGMFGVVFMLIVARYVFNIGFFWGEELARYLMIYMVLLGGAVALRIGQHPRLTLFLDMMPRGAQRVIRVGTDLLLALAIVTLFWQGLDMALQEGVMRTPALRITYFWVFLAMPIGAAAMLLQLVARQFLPVSLHVGEEDVGGDSVI